MKLYEELVKIREYLEAKIEKREEVFDSRSDKWQESEKAEHYEDETTAYRELLDTIQDAMDYAEFLS